MNKIAALFLAVMMMFGVVSAVAEEMPFDPVWIEFEEGFCFAVPSDWLELEVTDEMLEAGIAYIICSPDGTQHMELSWTPLDEELTIEELHLALAESYADAQYVELNGIGFVGFTETESDVVIFCCLDAAEPGFYSFYFSPASDEAMLEIAGGILGTIGNVE